MIHHRFFRHIALGLCSFCFSVVSFADCVSTDISKCVGSSKELQLTIKARLQGITCNVSLGATSNSGSKSQSVTFDFGNVLRTGKKYTAYNTLSRYLYIIWGDCDETLNNTQITFNATTCTSDHKVACDGVQWAGIQIEDEGGSEVEFNKWNDLVLDKKALPWSARYILYLVETEGSSENYSQSIQVIVRYN